MNSETLADILAEMRHCLEMTSPRQKYAPKITMRAWSNLADRIEAAAEREEIKLRESEAKMLLREYAAAPDESLTPSALELKRELLRLAPGNAAMREALEKALAYCESDQKSGIAYSDNDILVPMLRAALSAPARNCDRFSRGVDAVSAYYEKAAIPSPSWGAILLTGSSHRPKEARSER